MCVQKWHPKGRSGSDISNVTYKSDVQKWHPRVTFESVVQKWSPKIMSKCEAYLWRVCYQRVLPRLFFLPIFPQGPRGHPWGRESPNNNCFKPLTDFWQPINVQSRLLHAGGWSFIHCDMIQKGSCNINQVQLPPRDKGEGPTSTLLVTYIHHLEKSYNIQMNCHLSLSHLSPPLQPIP